MFANKKTSNLLILTILLIPLILCHSSYGMSAKPDTVVIEDCDIRKVSRIIDGDTFSIHDGEKVRLIGVDTPETVDPRKDVQWFGSEASRKLREWVDGETVCLRKDGSGGDDHDKYGRLLRYVWIDEGEFFVNAELIKQGYAFAYTRFPFQHLEKFRGLEIYARERNLGLWDEERRALWQNKVRKNSELAKTCGSAETICPQDAFNHIGERKTVRFFVKKTFDSGKAVFLNSENDFKTPYNFTAVIFSRNRRRFPHAPAEEYRGKTVDVTGVVKEYNGRAEIILKKSKQIRVLE